MRPSIPSNSPSHQAGGPLRVRRGLRATLLLVVALAVVGCSATVSGAAPVAHGATSGTGPSGVRAAVRPGTPGAGGAATSGATGPADSASPPAATPTSTGPGGAALLSPAVRARLSAALLRLRETYHLPGVQAVVRLADGETWTADAGYADLATRQRVTPTTLFDAGSITKTFLAALTLELADAHVLSLGDPVSRWLPDFTPARGVTIRELLDHTSGIGEPFDSQALLAQLGSAPAHAWTATQVLAYAGRVRFAPGHGWFYSNANYLLLGEIIRAATGRGVAALLRQRLLGPLGLGHTFLQGSSPPPPGVPRATGYDMPSDSTWASTPLSDGSGYLPFTSLATALGTAGALATTASDLARWAAALYGGHVLAPAALSDMLDFGLTAGLHPRWPYGLGVQRVTLDGQTAWGHSGLLSGFHSSMRYFPASGATVVVLTNADATNPDVLVSALVAALGPARAGIP